MAAGAPLLELKYLPLLGVAAGYPSPVGGREGERLRPATPLGDQKKYIHVYIHSAGPGLARPGRILALLVSDRRRSPRPSPQDRGKTMSEPRRVLSPDLYVIQSTNNKYQYLS